MLNLTVYRHLDTHIQVYVYIYIRVFIYVHMYIHTYILVYIFVSTCVCMHWLLFYKNDIKLYIIFCILIFLVKKCYFLKLPYIDPME